MWNTELGDAGWLQGIKGVNEFFPSPPAVTLGLVTHVSPLVFHVTEAATEWPTRVMVRVSVLTCSQLMGFLRDSDLDFESVNSMLLLATMFGDLLVIEISGGYKAILQVLFHLP